MNQYILWKYELLSGASMNSDNSGLVPLEAKYRKHFVNLFTAEVSQVTDLQIRKHKRNNILNTFIETYEVAFLKKEVSLLTFVVNEREYQSISNFLNMIGKKMKRKQIPILGYVWLRDVGDIDFEPHYHLIVAIPRISKKTHNELYSSKSHSRYDVQFMYNPKGLRAYLKKKDLFAKKNKRAYGKSRLFKKAT